MSYATKMEAVGGCNKAEKLVYELLETIKHVEAMPEITSNMDKQLRSSEEELFKLITKLEKIRAKIKG